MLRNQQNLGQRLQQGMQQKLSPQQLQYIKLLQLTTQGLEQRIKEELETNPILEQVQSEEEWDRSEQERMDSSSLDSPDLDVSGPSLRPSWEIAIVVAVADKRCMRVFLCRFCGSLLFSLKEWSKN